MALERGVLALEPLRLLTRKVSRCAGIVSVAARHAGCPGADTATGHDHGQRTFDRGPPASGIMIGSLMSARRSITRYWRRLRRPTLGRLLWASVALHIVVGVGVLAWLAREASHAPPPPPPPLIVELPPAEPGPPLVRPETPPARRATRPPPPAARPAPPPAPAAERGQAAGAASAHAGAAGARDSASGRTAPARATGGRRPAAGAAGRARAGSGSPDRPAGGVPRPAGGPGRAGAVRGRGSPVGARTRSRAAGCAAGLGAVRVSARRAAVLPPRASPRLGAVRGAPAAIRAVEGRARREPGPGAPDTSGMARPACR